MAPLSRKPFRVEDVREPRILISYREDDETIPLDREQFETLLERINEAHGAFEPDRLPSRAEPYATVTSLRPRFERDDQQS